MTAVLLPAVFGILIVILGIGNLKGDTRSIHWYHRQRVSDEDLPMFGKLMGIGTICCGVGLTLFGLCALPVLLAELEIFNAIGMGLLITSLVGGLGISLYAMFKYNRGVF